MHQRSVVEGQARAGGGRERGVVAACSYEARKFGIHSAMPMKTAMRLCPQAVVVGGTRGEYSRYSRWVTEIIAAKAPLFEKASIDEFSWTLRGWSGSLTPISGRSRLGKDHFGDEAADLICAGVEQDGLKIATQEAKPNGYIQVLPGMEREFLAPLKVNKIPGVGEHTYQALQEMGIVTIRDLSEQESGCAGETSGEIWGGALE